MPETALTFPLPRRATTPSPHTSHATTRSGSVERLEDSSTSSSVLDSSPYVPPRAQTASAGGVCRGNRLMGERANSVMWRGPVLRGPNVGAGGRGRVSPVRFFSRLVVLFIFQVLNIT